MACPTLLAKCNLATEINILEQTICIAEPCILLASNRVDDQAFFARDTSYLCIAASQLLTLGESPKRSYLMEGERWRFVLVFITTQILCCRQGVIQAEACIFSRELNESSPITDLGQLSRGIRIVPLTYLVTWLPCDWGRSHLTASAESAWNRGRFATRGRSILRGRIPPSPRSAWLQRRAMRS